MTLCVNNHFGRTLACAEAAVLAFFSRALHPRLIVCRVLLHLQPPFCVHDARCTLTPHRLLLRLPLPLRADLTLAPRL
jgi:hypothetical protein